MNINLNTEEYLSKDTAPFNNNKAGIVEITISSVAKNSESNRWEITFQDGNGGRLRDFYYYVDPNHANMEKQLKAQGMALRHFWIEMVGETALPEFSSPENMLDTVMGALQSRVSNVRYRIAVDYGNGNYHNTNLNRKKYVPFLEKVVSDTTKLFMNKHSYTAPAVATDLNELVSKPSVSSGDDWLDNK